MSTRALALAGKGLYAPLLRARLNRPDADEKRKWGTVTSEDSDPVPHSASIRLETIDIGSRLFGTRHILRAFRASDPEAKAFQFYLSSTTGEPQGNSGIPATVCTNNAVEGGFHHRVQLSHPVGWLRVGVAARSR